MMWKHRWFGCCGHGARIGPCWAWPPLSPEEEASILRRRADWLREELEAINQRLAELGKKAQEPGEG